MENETMYCNNLINKKSKIQKQLTLNSILFQL